MVFYNTEAVFGSVINGITIAMEEQKAKGAPIDDETITSVKSGLMGPMAGVGDSLDWATFKPIIFRFRCNIICTGKSNWMFRIIIIADHSDDHRNKLCSIWLSQRTFICT